MDDDFEVEIRGARPSDLDSLVATIREPRAGTHQRDLEKHARGAMLLLVAAANERIVGHALVHWSGPRAPEVAALLPDCPEISNFDVVESLQSRGIGTRMLDAMETLAIERDLPRLGLGVEVTNERASALYARRGYRPAGPPVYLDRWSYVDAKGVTHDQADPCTFLVKKLLPE